MATLLRASGEPDGLVQENSQTYSMPPIQRETSNSRVAEYGTVWYGNGTVLMEAELCTALCILMVGKVDLLPSTSTGFNK